MPRLSFPLSKNSGKQTDSAVCAPYGSFPATATESDCAREKSVAGAPCRHYKESSSRLRLHNCEFAESTGGGQRADRLGDEGDAPANTDRTSPSGWHNSGWSEKVLRPGGPPATFRAVRCAHRASARSFRRKPQCRTLQPRMATTAHPLV